MQVVILAAGESSRFYPFDNLHKSMVRLMGKPILQFTIEALRRGGIRNIIMVVNGKDGIKNHFGTGANFGVSIQYVIQENPEGAGDALLLADKHITGDFFLLNASHVEVDTFIEDLLKTKRRDIKAVLLAKKKENGILQGVLKFTGNKVDGIVEKPKAGKAPSDICVVGIYLFEKGFLDTLKKTPKKHYQLEAAISAYARKNNVVFVQTSKETVSLKYPWDLLKIKDYLFKNLKMSISSKAEIAKSAEIIGKITIEDGAKIMEGARIKGQCFIGKNVVIGNNTLLRNNVDVEEDSIIGAYMEMKNTIVMKGSTTHSGFIGDSVIGEDCKIAAQFCTGNVRLDRNAIKTVVKAEKVATDMRYLGAMIGTRSKIGLKVSTMPGVIIGKNVIIGPSTVVINNVPDNTKYYTKFKEIVNKK